MKGGQFIIVMITASHNPGHDNGVKLVDPAGEMLEQEWEGVATKLANCPDAELRAELTQACKDGILAVGGKCEDIGLVTTPQLHYIVVCLNTRGAYGQPTLSGYYDKLSSAFNKFMSLVPDKGQYSPSLVFDGANGVGAVSMAQFQPLVASSLSVTICNNGQEGGELNSGCGADYVKVKQTLPRG